MATKGERRRHWRYPAAFEVRLGEGIGVSHNVSASGLYLETDSPLAPGQRIAFSLTLNKIYPDVPLELQCTGTIVRIERRGRRRGVAMTIDSWSLQPSQHVSTVQQGQRLADTWGSSPRLTPSG